MTAEKRDIKRKIAQNNKSQSIAFYYVKNCCKLFMSVIFDVIARIVRLHGIFVHK